MVFNDGGNQLMRKSACQKSKHACTDDDRGKRDMKKVDCYECGRSNQPHRDGAQSPAANSNNGRGYDRQHRRLQTIKDRGDPPNVAISHVNVAKRPQDENRRKDEQRPGDNAAPDFVKKPSEVNGELLCLGSGEQHAKIQSMKKSRLVDPFLLFDQLSVHHCDLSARSAEGYEAKLQPKSKRFTK